MIFIGNFKNNIPTEEYVKTLTNYNYADDVYLALPLVYIAKYESALHTSNIIVGAQKVDLDEDFANRGEVNAKMLKDVGSDFVLLGHRKDKKLNASSFARIRKKMISVIENGMKVVISVGETMEEYETGKTCQVVERQIKELFKGMENYVNAENVLIAYEPKWAVGTGLCLSANELKMLIRNIKSMIDAYAKKKCKVVFGGSCNMHNIPKYAEIEEIDGFIMSNACLDAKQFVRILCGETKKEEC